MRSSHFAGNADDDQRRRGRLPGIGLDRERGADQRGGRAAHGGDARHQRMAVGDDGEAARIADEIVLAGQAHDSALGFGETRQRRVVDLATAQCAEFGSVQPQRPRLLGNQRLGKRRQFVENLICFAACIEGLFFFGSFAYVYFLRNKGLLPGLATATNWIFRDESMHIDAAMGTAFRISSAALVMALIQQPQGKEGFRSFLSEVATYQGEMPSLLRKHFPGLNLSETSLAKWWALQLANTGGQNLTTEILTIDQTETALNQALNFNFSDAKGVLQQKELKAWPELAALPAPERSQALEFAQEALVRLSYRCFPSYRPLLAEYQIALSAIAKKSTQNLSTQLQALTEQRTVMMAKAKQGRDYLKLFEVTRAYESSGAFDNYIRFTEQLKTNHRTDKCSKYLDLLETAFNPKIDAMLPKLTKQ